MKVEDVKKLSPKDRFLYWIGERHAAHLRRLAGAPRPWTDDEIMQRWFFTNPFRENDKTTVWFRENVRQPLRDDVRALMATVIFRWFNLIPTGELLLSNGLLHEWDEGRALNLLNERWAGGEGQVFTGAFMIKAGNGPRGSKIPSVCRAITTVWRGRQAVLDECSVARPTLKGAWRALKKFPYLGGFMSYEIVCDLRWTCLLRGATDVDLWCNQGPGARRGMNRLLGRRLEAPIPEQLYLENCRKLLEDIRTLKLREIPHRPEMREVEHILCETDKYSRALDGGPGRLKRRYDGALPGAV